MWLAKNAGSKGRKTKGRNGEEAKRSDGQIVCSPKGHYKAGLGGSEPNTLSSLATP